MTERLQCQCQAGGGSSHFCQDAESRLRQPGFAHSGGHLALLKEGGRGPLCLISGPFCGLPGPLCCVQQLEPRVLSIPTSSRISLAQLSFSSHPPRPHPGRSVSLTSGGDFLPWGRDRQGETHLFASHQFTVKQVLTLNFSPVAQPKSLLLCEQYHFYLC